MVTVKRHFSLFFVFCLVFAASYVGMKIVQKKLLLHTAPVVAVYHLQPAQPIQAVKLPAVQFYDKAGHQVSLDNFRGKVVLVNLWATWCLPCVAEMPSLDRLQGMMPKDKFQVVAIAMDRSSMDVINGFMQKNKITNIEPYWDKDRQIPLKWKYDGLPTSFLIDQNGTPTVQFNGAYEWDKEPMLKKIRVLLPKS